MGNKQLCGLAVLLIIAILAISGCAPKMTPPEPLDTTTTEPVETAEEETTDIETPPAEKIETEAEPEAEEQEEETSDYNFEALPKDQQRKIKLVRSLLAQASESEENYFFRYSGPGVLQTAVWIKGDLMKREMRRPAEMDKTKTYNMVYLNLKTLKAEGYCETSKATCWDGHGPFPETFSKWTVKTPKQWVLELGDEFTWALDNKVGDQLYHIVDFRPEGKTVRVYVNDYKGWPAKVEVYHQEVKLDSLPTGRADETYIYDDMDIGGVSDRDVKPQ